MTTLIEKADAQIEKITALRASGRTQQSIAQELGLTQPAVSLALKRAGAPVPTTLVHEATPIHLVARNPKEMADAQTSLIVFFERKVAATTAEENELAGALEEAFRHGWKTQTLENQNRRAASRRLFYEKCLAATRAGYTIIPDIPMDVFAIRTRRSVPRRNLRRDESSVYTPNAHVSDELPQILAPGEGGYQNPEQFVKNARGSYKDDKGKEIFFHEQWATEFDAIEFPAVAAVPYVMNATQQAMALRVFDQIGISPQGSIRSADPLIIGQILGVRSGWAYRKTASFLIAWHLDLRTL